MDFESIKSSKFDAYKSSKIVDSFSIVGGHKVETSYKSGDGTSGADCLNEKTDNQSSSIDGDGVDYDRGSC